MVTPCSLRLGFDLLREKNCIELRPILSDCRRRNPQNLAGSVPNVPTSANILTQKKEQKSLLLESVIDFASLVFHCVGSAIYAYQSGIGYFADLRLLRLTPFPWNPRQRERKHCLWQYKTKRERCLSKLNSFSFSFCTCGAACALYALVIPAGFEPTTHSLEGCCSIQLSYGTRPVFGRKPHKIGHITPENRAKVI